MVSRQQLDAAACVVARIVAVGGLGAIDVPIRDGIALLANLDHFLQRRTDDGAARFLAVEKLLLLDLARLVGMADEHDVHPVIFALQEQVQQDEEPLGEILFAFAHRGRNVHQAEHDRLRAGNGHAREPVVANVDRIDEGNRPLQAFEPLDVAEQLRDALPFDQIGRILGPQLVQFLLETPDFVRRRPPQRQTSAHAVAHGAQHVEVGRRAVVGIAGPPVFAERGVLQRGLDEFGQFEIVEQDVEKFFFRQREGEGVLARARIGGVLFRRRRGPTWASRSGRRIRTPCCRAIRARSRRRCWRGGIAARGCRRTGSKPIPPWRRR